MELRNFDFRVWDYDNKYMYYPSKENLSIVSPSPYVIDGKEQKRELEVYNKNNRLIYPYTCKIELWSGFYDKNNEKIYENDILNCDSFNYIVSYEKGAFMVKDIMTKEAVDLLDKFLKDNHFYWFVIGNIHENTELLKKVSK